MIKSLSVADRASAFRLQRLSLADGSFATAIDTDVDKQLTRLDELLGKRVIRYTVESIVGEEPEDASNGSDTPTPLPAGEATTIERLLARVLMPWRPKAEVLQQGWPKDSLADYLAKAKEDGTKINPTTSHATSCTMPMPAG